MAQRKWALQLHFSKRPERGLTADIIWNVYEASKDCPGTKWQVLSSHETVSAGRSLVNPLPRAGSR